MGNRRGAPRSGSPGWMPAATPSWWNMLAGLARAQEPEAVWTELAGRLKWLLDFERCDVAVINPDGQTYHLQTVFEARPGIPRVREAHVPLAAGLLGVLLQRGTPSLLLELPSDHGAPLTLVDPWLEGGSLASVFAVRLHVQGQTVGGLHVGRARAGGYAAADVEIVRQVAAQLSLVVERWHLRAVQRTTVVALHQSEALNHQLLESSGDAISLLDLAGHLLLMNPSGQRAWEIDDLTPYLGASWVACWEGAAPQAAAAVAAAARGAPGHFEGCVSDPPLGDADLVGRPGDPDPGSPGAARTPPGHRARHHGAQSRRAGAAAGPRSARTARPGAHRRPAPGNGRAPAPGTRGPAGAALCPPGPTGRRASPMKSAIRSAPSFCTSMCWRRSCTTWPRPASRSPEALTEIKTHLARLDDLVQDYLSLVRVGAIQLVPTDMGMFVTQFAQDMTPALAAHGITLQLVGLAELGEVALHPNTFRRALLNLVQNAIDAMPQGGTLTLQGRQQEATVQLDVRDTGSGIPPEHLAQIFEPLHTTKPGGTGLGLYIVQEVVAAHRGQVAVQSTVGVGTTFTITLPMAGAAEIT